MLQPSKTKFRKYQKGDKNRRIATKGNTLKFGDFGLKSLSKCRITARQIEAARITISKFIRRSGKMWIRIFPDKPITKKPIEVRQGKGKGNVEFWVFISYPGKMLFEIGGTNKSIALKALKAASYKLPVRTTTVSY